MATQDQDRLRDVLDGDERGVLSFGFFAGPVERIKSALREQAALLEVSEELEDVAA